MSNCNGMDDAKKAEKDGEISQDDSRLASDEVQKLTDQMIGEVDSMGPEGHLKVPQVGRVVIQDDVEIGANTTIDRGANRDTVIGEGTKIDNQVQIGHNVVIGRHCVLVSQVGLSGSCTLEDFVAIGGQTGVRGHERATFGGRAGPVAKR